MIRGFSHVSIAVPDLEAAARVLHDRYGLTVGERRLNAEQGVLLAYVELGNARLELMEPSRPDSPIARFLERNPKGGLHHFALAVDGVERTADELREHGARILGGDRPQHNVDGRRIAFIHPADFLGALVELEERGDQGAEP